MTLAEWLDKARERLPAEVLAEIEGLQADRALIDELKVLHEKLGSIAEVVGRLIKYVGHDSLTLRAKLERAEAVIAAAVSEKAAHGAETYSFWVPIAEMNALRRRLSDWQEDG